MALKEVSVFNTKKDFLIFLGICVAIFSYSLLIEYHNYKNLTRFKTALVNATVIKQYTKTKESKTYQVLKLKAKKGFSFYTSAKNSLPNIVGKNIELEIWAEKKSFYEYLTYFYSYSRILNISDALSLKEKLNSLILKQHSNMQVTNVYQALYTATPLSKELQTSFSSLGLSHLLAISGFHLGVLSGVLFFLLRYPYKFLQNKYFVYRNSKRDLFSVVAFVLLVYLLFLDSPASLLRAFTMLIIGFFLYDRGMKIISMQTLFLTVMLLLSFFIKLFFSIGFLLSVSGVYFIFLFLIYFKNLSKVWQFILVPFWVYIMMLPFSLALFSSFSIYHPLSIIFTSAFTIFYPFSILIHLVGYGNLFDAPLKSLIDLGLNHGSLELPYSFLVIFIALSLMALYKKIFLYLSLCFGLGIFTWAIYKISFSL